MEKTNKIKLLIILSTILIVILLLVFWQSKTFKKFLPGLIGGRVIEERLTTPNMTSTTAIDGRILHSSNFLTHLAPKSSSDRIIVPMAKLTIKQGLEVAKQNAGYWSDDIKLVYVKSLGAVTLDGQSSQWLYVFGSTKKRSGLGVVIREKEVIANLELATSDFGHDLPADWNDVKEAIYSLVNSPDFFERSIGGLSLYFNEDNKLWSFGIALDQGQSISMPLKK